MKATNDMIKNEQQACYPSQSIYLNITIQKNNLNKKYQLLNFTRYTGNNTNRDSYQSWKVYIDKTNKV